MTPEQLVEFQQMKEELQQLRAAATIPFDVEQAFTTRLKTTFATGGLTSSAKSATSETIEVNSATTTLVQLAADGYLQTVIGGTTYYIPIYT